MDELFWAVCEVCDTETEVSVIDADETPEFCPMCGEQTMFTTSREED